MSDQGAGNGGRLDGPADESRVKDEQKSIPDTDAGWVSRIQDKIAAWFAGARRDLPWRADRDPYRILVSEMMLVQTTVAAAGPYFERFVGRFPDVASLAAAEEVEVLKAWEGLGYYRRARQLHAAARIIAAEHGGEVPSDPGKVRALPGVGRYIAGAVLSQAFDLPEPIVEANTQRVLARLIAWRGEPGSSKSVKRLWECAERLVPAHGAGDFNQGLMELGALICTPRSPSCLICPVSAECEARAEGLQDRIPAPTPRAVPLAVAEATVVARQGGRLLVVRRGPDRLWEGFWEFPTFHLEGANPAGRPTRPDTTAGLADGFAESTGLEVEIGPERKRLSYTVTKHRVSVLVREAGGVGGDLMPGPGIVEARWMNRGEIAEWPFTSPARRIAAWAFDDVMDGTGET